MAVKYFILKFKVKDEEDFNSRDFEEGMTLDLQENPYIEGRDAFCIPLEEWMKMQYENICRVGLGIG